MYQIKVVNLCKTYNQVLDLRSFLSNPIKRTKNILVLDNISLDIRKGELFCILGPNRSGKSTLLKILATLITPSTGTCYIQDRNIVKHASSIKKIINIVSGEERSFYWRLTGRENLYFFGRFYNLTRNQINRRVSELFDLLEIKDPDIRFQEYSSGIKQRMAIARALLNDPEVILMDEVTMNLDVHIADKIKCFIKEELVTKRNKTVVYTTHNINEAQEMSSGLAFMVKGAIKKIYDCKELEDLRIKGNDSLKNAYIKLIENYAD